MTDPYLLLLAQKESRDYDDETPVVGGGSSEVSCVFIDWSDSDENGEDESNSEDDWDIWRDKSGENESGEAKNRNENCGEVKDDGGKNGGMSRDAENGEDAVFHKVVPKNVEHLPLYVPATPAAAESSPRPIFAAVVPATSPSPTTTTSPSRPVFAAVVPAQSLGAARAVAVLAARG